MPLTAQSWDIQLARAAAYEKLSIFRASLRAILKLNKHANSTQRHSNIHESVILTSLVT